MLGSALGHDLIDAHTIHTPFPIILHHYYLTVQHTPARTTRRTGAVPALGAISAAADLTSLLSPSLLPHCRPDARRRCCRRHSELSPTTTTEASRRGHTHTTRTPLPRPPRLVWIPSPAAAACSRSGCLHCCAIGTSAPVDVAQRNKAARHTALHSAPKLGSSHPPHAYTHPIDNPSVVRKRTAATLRIRLP